MVLVDEYQMIIEMLGDDEGQDEDRDMYNDAFFVHPQHGICVNLNDTFLYACGDAEVIPRELIPEVHTIYMAHGWYGLVAWSAHRRDTRPLLPIQERPEYIEAVRWLNEYYTS